MPAADLTTAERKDLAGAMASAFYDATRLEELLYYGDGLGVALNEITPPSPLPGMITAVIKWAEGEGKTAVLIEAAHQKVPGNNRLRTFYGAYKGSAQRQVTREVLERITESSVLFQDPTKWRDRMAQAEACVCCVVIGGQRTGTGFLAAPGIVVTNHHVVEGAAWQDIRVEFDYQADAAGALTPSRFYSVSAAPLAASPWHAIDKQHPKPPAPPPDTDALDFALLPVNGQPEETLMSGGRKRGVLPAPQPAPALQADMPLLILQHPQKPPSYGAAPELHPLKFAFDRVTEINANLTRVRYKVNTEPGASGSPCFDPDWNLVALHHAGDPRGVTPAEYNEGIPIATIRAQLPAAIRQQLKWA